MCTASKEHSIRATSLTHAVQPEIERFKQIKPMKKAGLPAVPHCLTALLLREAQVLRSLELQDQVR